MASKVAVVEAGGLRLASSKLGLGSQIVNNKNVFRDNSNRSLYRPGQFLRMFLRPVNSYDNN